MVLQELTNGKDEERMGRHEQWGQIDITNPRRDKCLQFPVLKSTEIFSQEDALSRPQEFLLRIKAVDR